MRDLNQWKPCKAPTNAPMEGRLIRIVPFDPAVNGALLWQALGGREANTLLQWFGWPIMENADDLLNILTGYNEQGGWSTCIFEERQSGAVVGMARHMRTDTANGVTEVGAVGHGPAMARSPIATEAHYLMARLVFDTLGYRRYEWKLNNSNQASHRAAVRFGFTFEGVFRQHQVTARGDNRDTAWYSMLDSEWPKAKAAFEAWLDPDNFDADGRQRRRLEAIREAL